MVPYSTKLSYSPGGYDEKELSIRDALVSKQRKVRNVEDDEGWMEEGGIERGGGGRQILLSTKPPCNTVVAFGVLVWPSEVNHAPCMRAFGSDRSASYPRQKEAD
ncbi:hypothetical protein N7530_010004 [Penicillium desertorum]|uniref:Uncharacterized protein n=1 Tax=Penicillium desertorum TaxID=1303715 RepID=A0A9W9WJL3_9EURO|nr:hypothetical protein N7530_010004 [Penicillium desertorum]